MSDLAPLLSTMCVCRPLWQFLGGLAIPRLGKRGLAEKNLKRSEEMKKKSGSGYIKNIKGTVVDKTKEITSKAQLFNFLTKNKFLLVRI